MMGIHAISATYNNGIHSFNPGQSFSSMAQNRLHQYAVVSNINACTGMCHKVTNEVNLKGTGSPCEGLILIDNGQPNCLIFVKLDKAPGMPTGDTIQHPAWTFTFITTGVIFSFVAMGLSIIALNFYSTRILPALTDIPAKASFLPRERPDTEYEFES